MRESTIGLENKPIESKKWAEEQQRQWKIFDGDPDTIPLDIESLEG
jgi:hypothetical protein